MTNNNTQPMTDEQIHSLFYPCFDSIHNLATSESRPLLAHYTSLDVLEKIMANNEIWLSSPLFMNDMQEMQFGISEGQMEFGRLIASGDLQKACGSEERAEKFRQAYMYYYQQFDNDALDVYVFCLSEHDPSDYDGRLSMWRGYGSNGNGTAIVFSTDFLFLNKEAPLLFAKVQYDTDDGRRKFIAQKMRDALEILAANNIPNDKLFIAAYQMFELIAVNSLISKHLSFAEENEWRMIYLPNRDVKGLLKKGLHYIVGKQGIEPKLRFETKPLDNDEAGKWTFEKIINRIILGPSHSTVLAERAIGRMLELTKKSELKAKLKRSNIPFRPTK